MRTTVTLDPDVERSIRDVMRERTISFKEAVADSIEDEELNPKLALRK